MTCWRYMEEDGAPADYGLATDEFLMEAYSDNTPPEQATLRLYTYRDHCALVGRFQNIHAELNLEYCRKENMLYSRRLTGGGAIIMGKDQLGICLAAPNNFASTPIRELYHLLATPVITALDKLGIVAAFRGKNDLEAGGKKIAGLGIYVNPYGAIQFHTSLLVDLDISTMLQVLCVPMQKLADKEKIHSVAQRITTVSREVGRKVAVDEVRSLVKSCFEQQFNLSFSEQPLDLQEREAIEQLAAAKYRHEDWIFQRSPQADMTGMGLKKTPAGLLRVYVALQGETIKSALITGDFFGREALFSQIESHLKWSPLDKENIGRAVKRAFGPSAPPDSMVTADDLAEAIWRAGMSAMRENRCSYRGSCYYPDSANKNTAYDSIADDRAGQG